MKRVCLFQDRETVPCYTCPQQMGWKLEERALRNESCRSPYLAELATGLEEVELKASNGEINQKLPMDTVKEGGESEIQVKMKILAPYLSEKN